MNPRFAVPGLLFVAASAVLFGRAGYGPFGNPIQNLLIALGGTVVLALLIMRIPLGRAVHFKAGEAIRYA